MSGRSFHPWIFVVITLVFTTLHLEPVFAESGSLRLTLELDAAKYLPDQPIMVLACVQNKSGDTLEDLAPLDLGCPRLRFSVRREGSTQPVPGMDMILDFVFSTEGLRVAPGESQCEAENLLNWFGQGTQDTNIVGESYSRQRPEPGGYVLNAEMTVHTGMRKNLPQLLIRSHEVSFEVVDSDPRSADPHLGRFLDHAPSVNTTEFRQYCAQWFPRAYRSPNFILLYYAAGMSRVPVPIDTILDGLAGAGVSEVRIASMARIHAMVADIGDAEKLAWVQRLRSRFPGMEPMQRVAQTWESRLRQKRYYYTSGP